MRNMERVEEFSSRRFLGANMKRLLTKSLLTMAFLTLGAGNQSVNAQTKGDIYKISADSLSGKINFADYKGKPILITNTASGCGYTSQLGDLQKVHEKYKAKGLVVIGFPTNDFNQENLDDVKVESLQRITESPSRCLKKFT